MSIEAARALIATESVRVVEDALAAGCKKEQALDWLEAVGLQWSAQGKRRSLSDMASVRAPTTAQGLRRRRQQAISCLNSSTQLSQESGFPTELRQLLLGDPRKAVSDLDRSILRACAKTALAVAHASAAPEVQRGQWSAGETQRADEGAAVHRSDSAIRSHLWRKGVTGHTAAFPLALFSYESTAPQHLQYSRWAAIDKSKRLPDNAEVDWEIGVARIPREWQLQIARQAMLGPDLSGLNMKTDTLELRVSADMPISDLLKAAHNQLKREGADPVPPLSLIIVPSAPPLDVPEPHNESAQCAAPPSDPLPAVCISPETTIAAADLFNQQERIVLTTMSADSDDVRRYSDRQRENSEPIHNPRPKAPEHIGMVNNLCGQRERSASETHLRHISRHRRGLAGVLRFCSCLCAVSAI